MNDLEGMDGALHGMISLESLCKFNPMSITRMELEINGGLSGVVWWAEGEGASRRALEPWGWASSCLALPWAPGHLGGTRGTTGAWALGTGHRGVVWRVWKDDGRIVRIVIRSWWGKVSITAAVRGRNPRSREVERTPMVGWKRAGGLRAAAWVVLNSWVVPWVVPG